jgi:hypothetical protein
MRIHVQISVLFLAVSLLAVPARCQSTYGSIVGDVKDSSDAVVGGAVLTLTNLATSERHTVTTDKEGFFQFPNLTPASYRLEAQMSGFQRYVKEPILIEVQRTVRVDVTLAVGQASERVEVTGETSLLDVESSTMGQVVERRKVEELPLNGRNPLALVALVPGVVPGGSALTNPALPNFYAWGNFQMSGALGNQSETMLDGGTVMGMLMNTVRLVPTEDFIQEFKVQTNNLSAEFGNTSGGIINLTSKFGTNQFHGSAFEFLRNSTLDASTFFNNAHNVAKPPLRQNQYGGTFGGPILKNRLFFFNSYEGYKQRKGQSILFTVPTADQRAGDFSKTLDAAGNLVPIYDAATTRTDPATNGNVRDAFPANMIPKNRLDPAAAKLANLIMAPSNLPGNRFTGINNFATNASQSADSDQFNTRIDYYINAKQKIFGRYSWWDSGTPAMDPYRNGTIYSIYPDYRTTNQWMVEHIYTLSPRFVIDSRYTLIKFDYNRIPQSLGIDLTTLGFPASLENQIPANFRHIPNFTIQGVNALSGGGPITQQERTHQISANATRISGRHTIKFGTDVRIYRQGYLQSNDPSGTYNYTTPFTARDPFTPSGGYGFASFLLGYTASATLNTPAFLHQGRIYRAFYAQDDFRVSSKLTLNLGLRWDKDGPITEAQDRLSVFEFDAPYPLAQQAGMPGLKGAQVLVNSSARPTRSWADPFNKQFAPRVGFAYNVLSKTVLRGGYGIFFLPTNIARREDLVEATGNGNSPFLGTIDGGRTPYNVLSNPFPNGISLPLGRDPNLTQDLTGQVFNTILPTGEHAYTQQWNFNVQQDLGHSALIEVGYVGLRGTKLPFYYNPLNSLTADTLKLGSALTQQVPNPFYGLTNRGVLSTPTVARGQLLRPFPQFDAVSDRGYFGGNSNYHSMQMKFQKRFPMGAGMLVSYTASKLITDTESQTLWLEPTALVQDPHNLRAERSLSSYDVPQRLVVSGNLDLPFGRGKKFLGNASGLGAKLVSGWVVNGIFTAQKGTPLFVTSAANLTGNLAGTGSNARPNSTGKTADLHGAAQQRLNQWFDTSQFKPAPAFTFGNLARTLPDVRGAGINNFDVSLFKNTRFANNERMNLQFRAEFYNLFNRVQFDLPGTSLGTPQFGVVTNQVNDPRLLQFALKLSF